MPVTLVMGVPSLRVSGPLTMRFGPRATLIPSLVAIFAGLLLFTRTPVDGSYVTDVMPVMVLLGGAVGLAILATFSSERTNGLLADGASQAAALNSGYHLAYLIGAVLVGAAIVVALTVLRPERETLGAAIPEPA